MFGEISCLDLNVDSYRLSEFSKMLQNEGLFDFYILIVLEKVKDRETRTYIKVMLKKWR